MRLFQKLLTLLWLLSAVPATAAQFLWLSDIHFDPLADRSLVDKLAAAEPTQWAEILATGAAKMPPYGRDTTWPLFLSALQAIAKTLPKPAFTIVTGDLLVHHFREHFNTTATVHDDAAFRSFVGKSMAFVTLQLKQNSPNAPVFVSLGNNDDECGDYAIQPDGPFLQDSAKAIGDLAGLTNTDSYVHLGSYSVLNPAIKHQRIIVLNTVFFSPRYTNRCGGQGSTPDPAEQLFTWLANELQSAQAHHEKVWLVYHIPPGVDAFATARAMGKVTLLWKDSYVSKFASLLAQYPGVVGPNFAGHIHVDDFRLLGGSAPLSPLVIINSAVSPITGQNPTFRIGTVDAHGRLKDFATYYLKDFSAWQLEYDFLKEWHVKQVNAASYAKIFAAIGDSPDMTARWTTVYSTSHKETAIPPGSFRQFYCAAGAVTAETYQACVQQQVKSTN